MNLFQVLALNALFLIGLAFGGLFSLVWPGIHADNDLRAGVALVFGIGFVLFFNWPIYRFFGWLPGAPTCPRCGSRKYAIISKNLPAAEYKCIQCGQVILLKDKEIIVLDELGNSYQQLKLKWPYFLGQWRKIPPPANP